MAAKEPAGSGNVPYDASEASKDKGEPSLTSTLTILQRTQLLQLLIEITNIQRTSITDTFRADATLPPDLKKDLASDNTEKDRLELNSNIDPGNADVASFDEQRKKLKEREQELRKLDVIRLRDGVLSWFDDWTSEMIQRVGEVVRLKKEAKKQLDETRDSNGKRLASEDTERHINADGKQPDLADNDAYAYMRHLYPAVNTPLAQIEEDKRILILHSLLLLLLSLKHYSAPSRVLLLFLCTSLDLPFEILDADEVRTATGLVQGAKELSGKAEAEKASEENKNAHRWKVGLATAAGAAIIGLTGGLAAPLVAAGVGSVMGGLGLGATAAAGYLGSLAGSTVLVGGLFGAYGGRMTGQMMDNYAKEVSDFAFLPVHDVHAASEQLKNEHHRPRLTRQESEQREEHTGQTNPQARRLRITIGVSGWLTNEEEVVIPWKALGDKTEVFALRFDLEALMNLGNAMQAMVSNAAWGYAKKAIISQTLLAGLAEAVAWPLSLAKMSRVVDNPFTVAKNRSDRAGAVLADALINRAQGERPVALVGYGLGARVVYACLQSLSNRKAFGLVDSAVLIGSPVPSHGLHWRLIRSVVSNRLVNVYSEHDYVLAYLYRTSSLQLGIAGLQRIEGVSGVENIDVSQTISGHLRYRYLVGNILQQIGWEDLSRDGLEYEKASLERMEKEAREKTLQQKGKETGLMVAGFEKTGDKTADPEERGKASNDSDEETKRLEREVQDKTQESLLQRGARYLSLSQGSTADGGQKGKADNTKPQASGSYLPNMPSVSMPHLPNMPNLPKVSAPSWASWKGQEEGSEGGKSK